MIDVSPRRRALSRVLLAAGLVPILAPSAPLAAWTPASQRTIAATAARLAPPDLHRQIARNRQAYLMGAVEPFESAPPESRVKYADGAGQLDRVIPVVVDNAVRSIQAHRPFNEIAYRLGLVSHYLAQANNPLAAVRGDRAAPRWAADYPRYVESAQPRLQVIFYGFRPGFDARRDLPGLVDETLRRSRGYHVLIDREYRRIAFRSGLRHFDDRSSAFGVTTLAMSHAVSDIAEVFRYIWLTAGGIDTRTRIPARGREYVLLPREPADLPPSASGL